MVVTRSCGESRPVYCTRSCFILAEGAACCIRLKKLAQKGEAVMPSQPMELFTEAKYVASIELKGMKISWRRCLESARVEISFNV